MKIPPVKFIWHKKGNSDWTSPKLDFDMDGLVKGLIKLTDPDTRGGWRLPEYLGFDVVEANNRKNILLLNFSYKFWQS